jgi:hypothetical protein
VCGEGLVALMSDASQGPGWWLASDGKWYSPELHPGAAPSQPTPAADQRAQQKLERRAKRDVPTLHQGDRWITVQGTFAYPKAVQAAQRKHKDGEAIGVLVPVTTGKYAGAVSVFVDGHQIGSLSHEVSTDFFPIVLELQKKRRKATAMIVFDGYDHVGLCAEPELRYEEEATVAVTPTEPAVRAKDFKKIKTFSTDPSWIAWPTLIEKKVPTVPSYGGHKHPNVPHIIQKYGHLVMVRFQIEPRGRSAGAIQCWVGSTMVCLATHWDEEPYQAVIESLAGDGFPATCRGVLARHTDFTSFEIFGRPERRPDDAPFLPPVEAVLVDVAQEEAQRLDDLLQSKAKNKTVRRVGTLVNHSGRTWLSLDGVWTGALQGPPRPHVDGVVAAGFPATCSVVLRRQPDEPLSVAVEVPDG